MLGPSNLSTQEIYDELKTLQPHCIVEFNRHIQDGATISYFPTDVLDGENTPPPVKGHNPIRTVGGKTYYLPFDFNFISQGRPEGCWFTYGEGRGFAPSRPFPPEAVVQRIRVGWKRGAANVLVAAAPDHTGRMRAMDVEQLRAIGRLLREPQPPSPRSISTGCRATASSISAKRSPVGAETRPWTAIRQRAGRAGVGSKRGWLELDLGAAKQFDAVLIEEGWDRTERFAVEIKESQQWRTILAGKTIGPSFFRKFPPVKARYVRLNILQASDVPTIWEFQLCSK